MIRSTARYTVLGFTVAALQMATASGHRAAAQAEVCLSAQVDYVLKIDGVVGESRDVSVAERCDADASIAISVNLATDQATRPAETVVIIIGQKPGSGRSARVAEG